MTMVTGLAFDLPQAPWMEKVRRLRERYEPSRASFPIEITVAGSSGLGWFSAGQAREDLEKSVAKVGRGFAPFSFRFASVERFPDSSVYYLAPHDSTAFHEFQRRLSSCGLRFEPTPYDYVPHCTIAILAPDAATEAHAEVRSCPVPADDIEVLSVTFWSVDRFAQRALQGRRFALGA